MSYDRIWQDLPGMWEPADFEGGWSDAEEMIPVRKRGQSLIGVLRMRLIVECEHERSIPHVTDYPNLCNGGVEITDPDAILAALAEAGVLEVEKGLVIGMAHCTGVRYVSPWKEAE